MREPGPGEDPEHSLWVGQCPQASTGATLHRGHRGKEAQPAGGARGQEGRARWRRPRAQRRGCWEFRVGAQPHPGGPPRAGGDAGDPPGLQPALLTRELRCIKVLDVTCFWTEPAGSRIADGLWRPQLVPAPLWHGRASVHTPAGGSWEGEGRRRMFRKSRRASGRRRARGPRTDGSEGRAAGWGPPCGDGTVSHTKPQNRGVCPFPAMVNVPWQTRV